MLVYESDCCDCSVPSYPCIGESCPRFRVARYYCDICKIEDVLYEYEGKQLCIECVKDKLEVVEGSEF